MSAPDWPSAARRRTWRSRSVSGSSSDHASAGQFRIDGASAVAHAADGVGQPVRRRVLQQVAAGAGIQRAPQVAGPGKRREDHDARRAAAPLQLGGQLESRHARHLDVGDHDVGPLRSSRGRAPRCPIAPAPRPRGRFRCRAARSARRAPSPGPRPAAPGSRRRSRGRAATSPGACPAGHRARACRRPDAAARACPTARCLPAPGRRGRCRALRASCARRLRPGESSTASRPAWRTTLVTASRSA